MKHILTVALLALSACGMPKEHQVTQNTIHVSNDPGGIVGEYAERIADLKASGTRAVFSDRVRSSATMYMALDHCVDQSVWFQFHGASFYGIPLDPDYFEYFSRLIADHYTLEIREWYMTEGRYGSHWKDFDWLVEHGMTPCVPDG